MKPLIESDSEIVSRMQQKFGATVVEIARGFQLQFPGLTDPFELSTANMWGAVFYVGLIAIFIYFLRSKGSWILIPVAFVIQLLDAYLMAG